MKSLTDGADPVHSEAASADETKTVTKSISLPRKLAKDFQTERVGVDQETNWSKEIRRLIRADLERAKAENAQLQAVP